jgi:hypothetical protein
VTRYEDFHGLHEAFWRTLVADSDPRTQSGPKNYFEDPTLGKPADTDDIFNCPIYSEPYRTGFLNATIDRYFFETVAGWTGLGPLQMREDDMVCLFLGGRVPFVIRATEVKGEFELVGESYVHGLMDGEGMRMLDEDGYCLQEIVLR